MFAGMVEGSEKKLHKAKHTKITTLRDRNASPYNLRVYFKLTKRKDKHANPQDSEKKGIKKQAF